MGQKSNPISLRLNIVTEFSSIWYAKKSYAENLHQDLAIRKMINETLKNGGIARVVIKRSAAGKITKLSVEIYASRPGIVIGKRGADIENLKKKIESLTKCEAVINIHEVKRPDLQAKLVAEWAADQLVKRASPKRLMDKALKKIMQAGAKGARIQFSGRFGGADIARQEWHQEGSVPLHTLKEDIDYAKTIAKTTYGVMGVKVWINRGKVGKLTNASEEYN